MSKTKHPRKPRSIEALTALLHCKGGPHVDRRRRRAKERRSEWKREAWS